MKTKFIIAFTTISLGLFIIGIITGFKYAEPKQTEEYAILLVKENGHSGFQILTTIGTQPTRKEFIDCAKPVDNTYSPLNYAIVTQKMNELNIQGFALFASNRVESVVNGWAFIFKRNIN